MDKTPATVNFQSDSLSVYIRQPQTKFRADWIYLFPESASDLVCQYPNTVRSTLLDILVLGYTTREGLIAMPLASLLGWGMSRARRYDAIKTLKQAHLVRDGEGGIVYLSPSLAYRGRAENFSKAAEKWLKLGGE